MTLPTGEQFALETSTSSGEVRATITAVAAGIRSLSINAIHGLLRYTEYKPIARERDSVTLSATIYPQLGYPFLLGTAVHYELVADGLKVTHFVENLGAEP